jgi:hypothetical protein
LDLELPDERRMPDLTFGVHSANSTSATSKLRVDRVLATEPTPRDQRR